MLREKKLNKAKVAIGNFYLVLKTVDLLLFALF